VKKIVPLKRPKFKPPFELWGQQLRKHGIKLDKFEMYTSDSPEVEESIKNVVDDLREEFREQYPIELPGYPFEKFLEDALAVINWRVQTDIPQKLSQGIISKEDAERAIYILMKSYEEIARYLNRVVV